MIVVYLCYRINFQSMYVANMETNFSLYCTIRLEDKKGKAFGDTAFESNKDSFSSDHVRGCIRTLLNHKILKEAFDPLLEVPGMQPGMRFSTLHKLCCSKSDEVGASTTPLHTAQ